MQEKQLGETRTYLLSQQFISNADFSVNNRRKPQLCSQQMRQKIPVSLTRRSGSTGCEDSGKCVLFHQSVFSCLESLLLHFQLANELKHLTSAWGELQLRRGAGPSHWEVRELHPKANPPPESAANFPPNLWAQGSPGWAQQEVGASQALHLYFSLRKTNKYLMALRDRARVCVLSPFINSCFKHLLDKN